MMKQNQITIEDLRQYRSRKHEIRSITDEIEATYYPIRSAGSNAGGGSTTPGDPTAAAVHHIQSLRDKQARLYGNNNNVDIWLDHCSDGDLAAICRYHYCLGMSWGQTGDKMFLTKEAVRSKVKRYFETC